MANPRRQSCKLAVIARTLTTVVMIIFYSHPFASRALCQEKNSPSLEVSRDDAGVLLSRIQNEPQLKGYYTLIGEGGRQAIRALDSRSKSIGAIPSRTDTINTLLALETKLSKIEWAWFEHLLREVQRHKISNKTLSDINEATIETMPSFNCKFWIGNQSEKSSDSNNDASIVTREFKYSYNVNGITFLSQESGFDNSATVRSTWIYNGSNLRTIEEVSSGLSNEFILDSHNIDSLYPHHSPLSIARLTPAGAVSDSNVAPFSGSSIYDDPSGVVFETEETVGGRNCIVYGFLNWAIALSPLDDYAVLEERFGEIAFDGKYLTDHIHLHRINSEFSHLGVHCSLPTKSVLRLRSRDGDYTTTTTIVEDIQVNPSSSHFDSYSVKKPYHISNTLTDQQTLVSNDGFPDTSTSLTSYTRDSHLSNFLFLFLLPLLGLLFIAIAYRRVRTK